MADASAGGATKSSAKSAKSDAQKFYKKKPDPEGAKLIQRDIVYAPSLYLES